jgi:FMN phosphatase YigB (HAD superfamily)
MDGFDFVAMDTERDTVELSGGSFDELLYLKNQLVDDAQYQTVIKTFVTLGQSQPPGALLEEGATEFIEYLGERHPFGILTFGSQEWQYAKLQASGLYTVPHIVLSHKHKIMYMKEWRDSQSGLFVLPEEFSTPSGYRYARELVLVDDKAAAFAGIEAGMRGYWLLHRELLPSQAGEVTTRVVRVTSFNDILNYEAAIDKT